MLEVCDQRLNFGMNVRRVVRQTLNMDCVCMTIGQDRLQGLLVNVLLRHTPCDEDDATICARHVQEGGAVVGLKSPLYADVMRFVVVRDAPTGGRILPAVDEAVVFV